VSWLQAREAILQPAAVRTYASLLGLKAESTRRPRRVPSPLQAWGARKLSTLTTGDAVAYFGSLTGPDGLGPQSVLNLRTALSTLLSDTVAMGHVATHPLKNRL
jgi:hypothetical protein